MEPIDRRKATQLVERMQEVLGDLSKEFGIELTMGRTTFSPTEVTLKVTGKLKDESGMVVTSDIRHTLADSWAKRNGITYEGEHFIGTVWHFNDREDNYIVTEVNRKAKTYPVILINSAGNRIKASWRSLTYQVVRPTDIQFMDWFTLDIDADDHTDAQERNYDACDDYLQAVYGRSPLWSDFIDCTNILFDKGLSERLWPYVFKMLITENQSLKDVLAYVKLAIQ